MKYAIRTATLLATALAATSVFAGQTHEIRVCEHIVQDNEMMPPSSTNSLNCGVDQAPNSDSIVSYRQLYADGWRLITTAPTRTSADSTRIILYFERPVAPPQE